MTARLTLICHGATGAMHKFTFPGNEPLEERSRDQAAALAGGLPRADRYWTSPELPARQTAEALGLQANPQPLLRDCDYGRWRGHSFDDICAREPEAVATWLNDHAAAPHGGESLLALMQRVTTWLDDEQTNHGRSIVITHASVIRAAIVCAIGALPHSFWRIDVMPLSCTRLSGTDGRWNLVSTGCFLVRD
jgi:broad specificity phosphatase PhoE